MISTATIAPVHTLLRGDVVTELRNLAVKNLIAAGTAYALGSAAEQAAQLQAASVISLVATVLDAQLSVVVTQADISRLVDSVSGSFGATSPRGTARAFEQIAALSA